MKPALPCGSIQIKLHETPYLRSKEVLTRLELETIEQCGKQRESYAKLALHIRNAGLIITQIAKETQNTII